MISPSSLRKKKTPFICQYNGAGSVGARRAAVRNSASAGKRPMTGRAYWTRPRSMWAAGSRGRRSTILVARANAASTLPDASSASTRAVAVSCGAPCSSSSASASEITLRFGRGPHPAADFREELPLRGRQTLDAGRVDLVEHAVDLRGGARVGIAALRGARRRRYTAAAIDPWRLRDQHARLRLPAITPLGPPLLAFQEEQGGADAAEMCQVRDGVGQAHSRARQQREYEVEGHEPDDQPFRGNGIGQGEYEHRMLRPVPGERDGHAEDGAGGAENRPHPRELHQNEGEERAAQPAQQIEENERPAAHPIFHRCAEHEQHQHVEDEVQ